VREVVFLELFSKRDGSYLTAVLNEGWSQSANAPTHIPVTVFDQKRVVYQRLTPSISFVLNGLVVAALRDAWSADSSEAVSWQGISRNCGVRPFFRASADWEMAFRSFAEERIGTL
jgi:hypothetical protein